jgi:cytoskeletal protein CcmA (bactofilin family)
MFNAKTKSDFSIETGGNSTSLVGAGTTIKGDISCNADIRIDGTITGNINSTAKVVIGPSGIIEGDIVGQQADIAGKVTGNLKIEELLQLKGNAIVSGSIYAGKLQIEPTASFNGKCHMNKSAATAKETVPEKNESTTETRQTVAA